MRKEEVLIVCVAFLLLVSAIGHFVPSSLPFKTETNYFEDVEFWWNDDNDTYVMSIREPNEVKNYTVSVQNTTLVYDEEGCWRCFGDVVTDYNAWGRILHKSVRDFHINVFWEVRNEKYIVIG